VGTVAMMSWSRSVACRTLVQCWRHCVVAERDVPGLVVGVVGVVGVIIVRFRSNARVLMAG
jgi:hypothetical protein